MNNNSTFVASLVDYINDTKPYHSKLTEVVEENRLFDSMNVKIVESLTIKAKLAANWTYNFFSSANALLRNMPFQRVESPYLTALAAVCGADEVQDIAGTPYVYSKKRFDGGSVNTVYVRRGDVKEPLVEGNDFHQSLGSFQFQIKQTQDANLNGAPLWAPTNDNGVTSSDADGIISAANTVTQQNALDVSNPASAVNRISHLINSIGLMPSISTLAQSEVQALQVVLGMPNLPNSYEALLNQLVSDATPINELNTILISADPLETGFNGWVDIPTAAGGFVVGAEYFISSLGTTDFTLIGASSNTIGVRFTATGVGVGTGSATPVWFRSVSDELSALSPSLARFYGVQPGYEYLGPVLSAPIYSDMQQRQDGSLSYEDVSTAYINVTNIVPNLLAVNFEEFTLTVIEGSSTVYSVVGSSSGNIGFVQAGNAFSTDKVSFNTELVASAPANFSVSFRPKNKIVIHPNAPLEIWNIIKVNPISHSRPTLISTRYGYIQDGSSPTPVRGSVTLLDPDLPTGCIVLEAISSTQFSLKSTVESYTATATVGVLFNDGRLAFTLVRGSEAPFVVGDRFYINISNEPSKAINLGLGFGYDLDSYDNAGLLDENGDAIRFAYDSRFVDYDLTALNLQIQESAVTGRKWRIVPIPGTPINTVKKDGSGPNNKIDLQDGTSGVSPDVPSNAAPLYSMAGDPLFSDPNKPNLKIYHATIFDVQYSDDDFATVTQIGSVTVGDTFTSVSQGISFTLAPGSKPFIAIIADDNQAGQNGRPTVQGGDVLSFEVINPGPVLVEHPISLTSFHAPHIVMHGDGFFEAMPADWSITFTSPSAYTVTGVGGTTVTAGGTITIPGSSSTEGLSFKGLGVHFTLIPGAVGFDAGDKFTFSTFDAKPTYLVHGSVSGWTEDAAVGKYYWNGKIGFTIPESTSAVWNKNSPVGAFNATAMEDGITYTILSTGTTDFTLAGFPNSNVGTTAKAVINPLTPVTGTGTVVAEPKLGTGVVVTKLTADCPELQYLLERKSNGYMVSRSDVGVCGLVSFSGTYSDKYITFTVADQGIETIIIQCTSSEFTEWNAQDVILLRPVSSARLPDVGDAILIQKAENESIGISLTPSINIDVSDLSPITIDQRFIDLDTHSAIPVSNNSPDTAILQGWLPLTVLKKDSSTSVAEFSDTATTFIYSSAASGETIGTVKQQGTGLNEPIIFEWDSAFFSKYLPLNAEANVVLRGGGWDDKVRVHISESIKFLIDGGPLSNNFLFNDAIDVNVIEDHTFNIFSTYDDLVAATIEDGPFIGFLPGYDNVTYDDDVYDLGQPPDIYAMLSKYNLTAEERADILLRWNFYLATSDVPSNEVQWAYMMSLFENDTSAGTVTNVGFGNPLVGLGIDIKSSPLDSVGTAIQEAAVLVVRDYANSFDSHGYDVGQYDAGDTKTAYMSTASLPPIPSVIPPGSTYASLQTPLSVEGVTAETFEIHFTGPGSDVMSTPTFLIWFPTGTTAQVVPAVTKLSAGKYSFSVPSPTEAKIIAQ